MSQVNLYLVDASPYIFRAYFAVPDSIRTPDGRPINAAYGFANFLLQLFKIEELTHLAVAFDRSLTTSFRNEIYPDYKAQRDLPPRELEEQIADCKEVAEALGIATFESERYEADDLVGTLAHRLRAEADRTVIVTGDKDLTQLLDEKTVVLDFAKNRWLDPGAVRELFGVAPDRIVDYLGLVGDSVDNIPGVPGVGKKSAQALLDRFDGLDEIYERIGEVEKLPLRGAGALRKKLELGRENAFLSRRLATIVRDVPLEGASLDDLRYRGARAELVETTFARLGFEGIRSRVPSWQETG